MHWIVFTVLFLPQPIVQREALYEVLYLSPVKLWLKLVFEAVVETGESEESLSSKARYPPGGEPHESMSIGRVRLGPIQVKVSTGAASVHTKHHCIESYQSLMKSPRIHSFRGFKVLMKESTELKLV